MASVP